MKNSAFPWSFGLGRIRGVEIRLHAVCVLLLAWFAIHSFATGGFGGKVEAIIFGVLVLGCVLLHELGHVIAARLCGVGAKGVTIFPFGGVTQLSRVPNRPAKEIMIALAGPAVSALLAIVFGAWAALTAAPSVFTLLHTPGGEMAGALASVNAALCLLNLLPAYPMDGGRIARYVLGKRMDDARAIRVTAFAGQSLAVVIGFAGLFGQPLLVVVAVILFTGASHEAEIAEIKEHTSAVVVRDVMVRDFRALQTSAPLNQAVDALLATSQREFPITDDQGGFCGMLTREDIVRGLQASLAATSVAEVMQASCPHVTIGAPLDRALALLEESGCQAIPVLDGSRRIIGLFTLDNISEALLVQTALAGQTPSLPPRFGGASLASQPAAGAA
jgi:Zn-dependent protease/predicted transcriptional regulator